MINRNDLTFGSNILLKDLGSSIFTSESSANRGFPDTKKGVNTTLRTNEESMVMVMGDGDVVGDIPPFIHSFLTRRAQLNAHTNAHCYRNSGSNFSINISEKLQRCDWLWYF